MAGDGGGFTGMAGPRATGEAPRLGVGMLGYAFMGKAHTNALKTLPYMMYPPVAIPTLEAICGRDAVAVAEAARRYGYARHYTDWHDLVADERVDVFDNGGPNDAHAEPCIAAAQAGKAILCEKPLGRTAEESRAMLDAVAQAGVKHMVGFNYRFVPAVVQARQLIEQGKLGRIFHWRASYLQEWVMDPAFPRTWRLDKSQAGSGALGDLGSHIIDLARFLVGEPTQIMALTRTFIPERPLADGSGTGPVDVDDAFVAVLEFANGALGTLEASRFCPGRKNHNTFEINAEKGSLRFDLERLNELEVFYTDEEPKETRGFHTALISEPYHPYWGNWWPSAHMIGWEHTFIHEFHHFFDAIVNGKPVEPYGATFVDGYRNAVICDAILESARTRRAVAIRYCFWFGEWLDKGRSSMSDKQQPLCVINSVAPIRICDNGGWTDTWFAEHGKIFNIGVYPYVEVQIEVFPYNGQDERIVIFAENYGERYALHPETPGWDRHPLLEATIELMRVPRDMAFQVTIFSEAPAGASTGTSAAVTVALVGALDQLTPGRLTPHEVAAAAHRVETEMLKRQSGIQDQLCSAFGGINFIEMQHYPHASVSPVLVPNAIWWELERRLALVYLGRTHDSSQVHEKVIRELENAGPTCKQLEDLRSTAEQSRDALYAGDFEALGRAMSDNTEAQARLNPALVSADARRVIDIAREHGALGWKVNGAGGEGGSVTLLCGPQSYHKRAMIREIEAENPLLRNIPVYLSRFGLRTWRQEPESRPQQ